MPMALVVISIAGLVFGTSTVEARIFHQVQILIGEQRANILKTLLQGAHNRADGVLATIVGLLILTFGATGVLLELREALNTVWEVPVRPMSTLREFIEIVKERLWSLALVFGNCSCADCVPSDRYVDIRAWRVGFRPTGARSDLAAACQRR
jgi:membrane protein